MQTMQTRMNLDPSDPRAAFVCFCSFGGFGSPQHLEEEIMETKETKEEHLQHLQHHQHLQRRDGHQQSHPGHSGQHHQHPNNYFLHNSQCLSLLHDPPPTLTRTPSTTPNTPNNMLPEQTKPPKPTKSAKPTKPAKPTQPQTQNMRLPQRKPIHQITIPCNLQCQESQSTEPMEHTPRKLRKLSKLRKLQKLRELQPSRQLLNLQTLETLQKLQKLQKSQHLQKLQQLLPIEQSQQRRERHHSQQSQQSQNNQPMQQMSRKSKKSNDHRTSLPLLSRMILCTMAMLPWTMVSLQSLQSFVPLQSLQLLHPISFASAFSASSAWSLPKPETIPTIFHPHHPRDVPRSLEFASLGSLGSFGSLGEAPRTFRTTRTTTCRWFAHNVNRDSGGSDSQNKDSSNGSHAPWGNQTHSAHSTPPLPTLPSQPSPQSGDDSKSTEASIISKSNNTNNANRRTGNSKELKVALDALDRASRASRVHGAHGAHGALGTPDSSTSTAKESTNPTNALGMTSEALEEAAVALDTAAAEWKVVAEQSNTAGRMNGAINGATSSTSSPFTTSSTSTPSSPSFSSSPSSLSSLSTTNEKLHDQENKTNKSETQMKQTKRRNYGYNSTRGVFDALECECDNGDDEECGIDSIGDTGSAASDSSDKSELDEIDQLFASLVEKVRAYNPEAVTATSFSHDTSDTSDASGSAESSPSVSAVSSTSSSTTPLLTQAYHYARAAHSTQCRKSGEPYITHPLGVAHIIADMKLDLASLLTALLHDTVEDTHVTLEDVEERFGGEIRNLVDGVTKVGRLPGHVDSTSSHSSHGHSNHSYNDSAHSTLSPSSHSSSAYYTAEQRQSENYRKLILAMAKDIRVVLVKLADRAHNMRTLQYMPPEKQRRIASETMEIYGPLAHRLGIHWIKTELEDNCFRYLHPKGYQIMNQQLKDNELERKEYEQEVVGLLKQQMMEAGVGIGMSNVRSTSIGGTAGVNGDVREALTVTGRTKGLWSIYSKMKRQGIEFDDVHDVIGFRIIIEDGSDDSDTSDPAAIATCYQALGILHSHWKPIPGKIKDYIALPKPNGYRSLHTSIIGPRGRRIEVQIRTREMHEVAESGIAAHWMYKRYHPQGKGNSRSSHNSHASASDSENQEQFAWLRELVHEVQRQSDPTEFLTSVKEDLFLKEVYVFSPRGDLYALARGSSVLDFAYKVHSDLGHYCTGAKVNGKMVGMKHLVRNGDTVEILTNKSNGGPKREWLSYVRTSKAKNRIRGWLKRERREESVRHGKEMLEEGLARYGANGVRDGKKVYQKKLNHLLTTLKLRDERHLFMELGYGRIGIRNVMSELFGAAAVAQRDQLHNGNKSKKEQYDESALQSLQSFQSLDGEEMNRFNGMEVNGAQGANVANRLNSGNSASFPVPIISSPASTSSTKTGIVVGRMNRDKHNILLKFCKNCTPLQGEPIQGVITQGKGVKIHRHGCTYLLEADELRIVDVRWDGTDMHEGNDSSGPSSGKGPSVQSGPTVPPRPVPIQVLCEDTPGVLAEMTRTISSLGFNIGNVHLKKLKNGKGLARLQVFLGRVQDLEEVMGKLRGVEGIVSVVRK